MSCRAALGPLSLILIYYCDDAQITANSLSDKTILGKTFAGIGACMWEGGNGTVNPSLAP